MTPSTFGFLTVGTASPLIFTSRTVLASPEKVENTVDLDGEMKRLRPLNQVSRVERYIFSSLTTGSIIGPEFRMLESSAYVTRRIFPGGEGMDDMYRLNSKGDNTPPCGTPCLTFLKEEFDPLK